MKRGNERDNDSECKKATTKLKRLIYCNNEIFIGCGGVQPPLLTPELRKIGEYTKTVTTALAFLVHLMLFALQ